MKRIVKFQAEDSNKEFDTEEDCLTFEATHRIGKAIAQHGAHIPDLDQEDIENLFYVLKNQCKEDVAYLLGLKVNDQDDSHKVQFAE